MPEPVVARYREALRTAQNKWEGVRDGLRGSFEPILASAATVILALLCLLFSDLNSNKSLGPIAATCIVFSLLATLTLLPCLLVIFGKLAFWPSKITASSSKQSVKIQTGLEELSGIWKRAGTLLQTHTRLVWVAIVAVLAIAALGLFQFKASGVPQTDIILSDSNAADGQKFCRVAGSGGGDTDVSGDQSGDAGTAGANLHPGDA